MAVNPMNADENGGVMVLQQPHYGYQVCVGSSVTQLVQMVNIYLESELGWMVLGGVQYFNHQYFQVLVRVRTR